MKVAIVSIGRSHLLNLARVLGARPDVEVFFYTMMPASRCRKFGYNGKVKSFLFPIGIGQMIVDRLPGVNPYRKSALRFRLRKAFDKLVACSLKKCDYLIGLNGCAVECSKAAKKKFGTTTICDQGSSHIKTQDAVHYTYSNVPISGWNTEYMLEHYAAVDHFMAACDYVRQSDIDNDVDASKIFVNPYGVNTEVFNPTENPKDNDESYDVIMVGSWWKHKGCDMLVEACLDRLKVKLLHVGSVIDCALPESPLFKHIAVVPENELPRYYAKSKVIAMPSLDEGFGLVLLQAAACGLQVVGSSRTGLRSMANLLDNHIDCIEIAEPLSVESITEAIANALTIADDMPVGMRTPYGDAIKNITWEAYGERYYYILKSLK